MIELYYRLIIESKRTIEQVPERYRIEVQLLLNV